MESSDEQMMFAMDPVQGNPVNYLIPEVSSTSTETISKHYICVKAAGKASSSDVVFCLPKEGGTINDLLVVKVSTGARGDHRNEAVILQEIRDKIPETYLDHFPDVIRHSVEERWLAMTAYNRSLALQDFVNHCQSEHIEIPVEFLAVLLHNLADIFSQLHVHGINHGDIHPGNILLQFDPNDTAMFPSIRIIDFEKGTTLKTLSSFKAFMTTIVRRYPVDTVRNHHLESFRETIWGCGERDIDFNHISQLLEELIRDTGASKTTLTEETRGLLQAIVNKKEENNVWVTEEDIKHAIKKASSSKQIGT